MSIKSKPCKVCESTWHSAFSCPYKPRKGLKAGKQYSAWKNTRKLWFEHNPPDENGLYRCYVCQKPLVKGKSDKYERVTLDHLVSRSRNPSLRHAFTNLAACCWSCNTKKGSLSIKEYHDKLYGGSYV